jgi:hypothetical protein
MRQKRFFAGPKKTPMDEAREALAVQVLAHVPVIRIRKKQIGLFLKYLARCNRWRTLTSKQRLCTWPL